MNTELFKKIHDIISVDRSRFNTSRWENCVAGWAIRLTTGTPLYAPDDHVHPGVKDLAVNRLALTSNGYTVDFHKLGASLLGLDSYESQVFYLDDDEALEFVRLASEGDHEGAREYLDLGGDE